MKILFFTQSFYPNIGGVEKHVEEVSKVLMKKGNKVTVVSEQIFNGNIEKIPNYQKICKSDINRSNNKNTDKSASIPYFKYKNIEVIYLNFGKNGWFKKFRIWWQLWKNRSLIYNSDLIHCHDVFIWYLPFRLIFYNKPVFTTFHGYESYPIRKRAIIVRKISENLSWGNICIGDFIKKWYRTNPTYVSYGAVRIKGQESKVKNQRSAIFIGRLDEQTGVLTYKDAVKIIKKNIADFKLTVIGDGKFKSKIKGRGLSILGFKDDPILYLGSHRFAFVSRYLSILEAMAKKKLVFAVYDNPVKKDYLKMSPFAKFIVISNTSSNLAEKVLYFLDHPEEEKKLVNRAFTWVHNQTWEKMAVLYLKLWRNY